MVKILVATMVVGVMASVVGAEVQVSAVEYKHGETVLQGWLAYDDAVSGSRPGVLVFPEWWGTNDYARGRAEQLAKLGYVAFAADMYGKGVVTKDPKEAGKLATPLRRDRALMRARAAAALETLKVQKDVDPNRIAAIGYCFGGGVALELARSGADIVGLVGFHCNLDTPNPADAKNIKGKVLVCEGGDDAFVSQEEINAFKDEMRKAKVNWQLNIYGVAKHSFTNPAADAAGMPSVAYNKQADQRSWEAMRQFFEEIFRAP